MSEHARRAGRDHKELLTVTDCYLLTADESGRVAVPGLRLVFDSSGLTVLKPDGSPAAILPWTDLTELIATARTETPEGQEAVVVEATTATRVHRFVIPANDPAALEARFAKLGRRVGKAGNRRTSVAVATLIAAVAAVVVVLVILSLH